MELSRLWFMIEMQSELCHNLCTNPVCKPSSTVCSCSRVSQAQLPSFLSASPKQEKLHCAHQFHICRDEYLLFDFLFREGASPWGQVTNAESGFLSKMHTCTAGTETQTLSDSHVWQKCTTLRVLQLNNLLPNTYLFHFSFPERHDSKLCLWRTQMKGGQASKLTYPFLGKSCWCRVWSDDTHTYTQTVCS